MGTAGHDSDAYRLLADEPVAGGIKRVVLGRVDDAIAHLEGTEGEARDDAIHEARKDLKKTRSAIRLVRDALGDDLYALENAHYREAGRLLSGFRDAEALIESLDSLKERFQGDAATRFTPLRASFEAELRAHREGDEQPRAMAAAAAALREGRGRIEAWPLSGGGWSLLGPGLRRTYRRGRRRLRDAERDPSDANLHEWRKRVKDLWYQLRLIRDLEPGLAGHLIDDTDVLADYLGDDHDLTLLRAAAAERRDRFDRAGDQRLLLELIDRRRGELRFAAFSLGTRLYDYKPKRFVKQLKRARRQT
ncbi:MAG: CHAD domain-containing protein [Solirubrobacterales bacterium]